MKQIRKLWRKLTNAVNNRGMQFLISLSFTFVALVGMAFIGVFLYQSYGRASEDVVIQDTQQLLGQVEMNLNTYLRNMMRISDAMYYNVIKNVDFARDDISQELNLLYEVNKDNLVSISCFTEEGELIGASPVGTMKYMNISRIRPGLPAQRTKWRICIFPNCTYRIFLKTAAAGITG